MILAVKVKLSTWAKQQGISYKTAWRWFKNGTLPVPYEQVSSGTIIVKPITESETENLVALYARVSSHDQKKDLDRQLARLLIYANNRGLKVSQTVTEIGSGLNGHRPKYMIEVLTSFCARLYGRRSAKNKAKKAF